jgi:hypothetical protein
MNLLKLTLQLILSGLLWVLITYWLVFVMYTIMYFVRSGPDSVIAWYSHIANMQFHWNWRVFLADQVVIMTTTVAVFILRRRLRDWRAAR